MTYQETTVDIKFVEVEGTSKVIQYAKSFMKNCGLILLSHSDSKLRKRFVVKGFVGSGFIDITLDLTGNIAKDVNAIYDCVNSNKELNEHAIFNGCRVATRDNKISARLYYSEKLNLN